MIVAWSARALDGLGVGSARRMLARLRRGLKPGAVLLLHDAGKRGRPARCLEFLPQLLHEIGERGLRPVTVSELLRASEHCQPPELAASASSQEPPASG